MSQEKPDKFHIAIQTRRDSDGGTVFFTASCAEYEDVAAFGADKAEVIRQVKQDIVRKEYRHVTYGTDLPTVEILTMTRSDLEDIQIGQKAFTPRR